MYFAQKSDDIWEIDILPASYYAGCPIWHSTMDAFGEACCWRVSLSGWRIIYGAVTGIYCSESVHRTWFCGGRAPCGIWLSDTTTDFTRRKAEGDRRIMSHAQEKENPLAQDFTLIICAGMTLGLLIPVAGIIFIESIIWKLGQAVCCFLIAGNICLLFSYLPRQGFCKFFSRIWLSLPAVPDLEWFCLSAQGQSIFCWIIFLWFLYRWGFAVRHLERELGIWYRQWPASAFLSERKKVCDSGNHGWISGFWQKAVLTVFLKW